MFCHNSNLHTPKTPFILNLLQCILNMNMKALGISGSFKAFFLKHELKSHFKWCCMCYHVYSWLSGVFNSSKNRFLQWEAFATRAFYLNTSELIKRHNLSSHGPKQDSSIWVNDPGNILLEYMSCRTYHELHLCVSVVCHQLSLCRVRFVLVFSYSLIWQSLTTFSNSISYKDHSFSIYL